MPLRRSTRRVILLGLAMGLIPVAWTIWVTTVTSSTFALVGGSDAVARVARHSAQLRWLIGAFVVAGSVWLQWRLARPVLASAGAGRTAVAIRAFVLQLVAAGMVGSLNWAVVYDPAQNALRTFWGGIQVSQSPLAMSADGPCVTSLEVHRAKLIIDGETYRLRRLPLPLEDTSLVGYLRQIPCPTSDATQTGNHSP